MQRETITTAVAAAALILGLMSWVGRGAVAQSQETKNDKRVINTNGEGKVRVRPDRARVFFGVQTFAPTVRTARSQNAAQVKQVTSELTALKIPDFKMKSTNLTVDLIQTEHDGKVPKIIGYRVTNTFTALVSSSDAEKLGPLASRVLDTALESGANLVEQILFFREDDSDAKREALAKAVQDARANAHALADGANKSVTDIIAINGQPEYAFASRNYIANSVQTAVGSGEGTSLMAGEQEITCNVSVTCTY
jgi:uncharacterized protein YggE